MSNTLQPPPTSQTVEPAGYVNPQENVNPDRRFERSQTKNGTADTANPGAARTRVRQRAGRGGGVPDAVEQQQIAATLGAELRTVRAKVGMTQRVLADRSGVAYRSIQDLEAGRRRPSSATLAALAVGLIRTVPPTPGLNPDRIFGRLATATGPALVVDTTGGLRRRRRHLRDAWPRYWRLVEAWWAGEVAAAHRAEVAFVEALMILDRPGALDDGRALDAAWRRLDEFDAWLTADRSGPWGTAGALYRYARGKGYPVRRGGHWWRQQIRVPAFTGVHTSLLVTQPGIGTPGSCVRAAERHGERRTWLPEG